MPGPCLEFTFQYLIYIHPGLGGGPQFADRGLGAEELSQRAEVAGVKRNSSDSSKLARLVTHVFDRTARNICAVMSTNTGLVCEDHASQTLPGGLCVSLDVSLNNQAAGSFEA